MVTKLATSRLVEYEKYEGIKLTTRGASIAESVAWCQCVATFFDRILQYDIDGRTAYQISFALPVEAVVRLKKRVDRPREDACRRIRSDSGGFLMMASLEG